MRTGDAKKKCAFDRILPRLLGAVLALMLLAAAILLLLPLAEGVRRTAAPDSADWMASLDDDVKLSELILPGSHDSATEYVQMAFFPSVRVSPSGRSSRRAAAIWPFIS